MYQLIAVIISFMLIPILIRRSVKLSYTLLITAAVLGILSGIGPSAFLNSLLSLVRDSSSLETILTVTMVAILGGLMKHFSLLDRMVNTMVIIIRNKKVILMVVPALMGLLVIPGGAMLSAPFVNEIGEELDIPAPRLAAINLVFRHIAMFILPYSTAILIVLATIPQLDYPRFILYNLFFVAIVIIVGYHIFLRDVKTEKAPPAKNLLSNILKLIIYTSPIYITVIINAITGWPFYITLIASVLIVYILSDKKDFIKVLFRSINLPTILTVAAVLIIKDIILNMNDLLAIFNAMFAESSGLISTLMIFLIASLFFGYITGNIIGALAIVLPMVAQLGLSGDTLYLYTYFVYGASFLGYFFSPLHLCQVFTLQVMGVTTGEVYSQYKRYAPTVFLFFLGSVFILRVIFG